MAGESKFDRPFRLLCTPDDIEADEAVELFKAGAAPVEQLVTRRRPVDWLIDGMLTRGDVWVFAGDPKVGSKSLLSMHICMCVLTGRPFLGRDVVRGGFVYCNFEDGEHRVARRFYALGVKENERPSEFHMGYVVTDRDLLQATLKVVQVTKPRLLVIDTLAHAGIIHGLTDENHPQQITRLISFYADLAHSTGTTIILPHHNRKDGMVMRGSSALQASLDGWWAIDPGKDNCKLVHATFKDGDPLRFGLRVKMGSEEDGTDSELEAVDPDDIELLPKLGAKAQKVQSQKPGRAPTVSPSELYARVYKALEAANGKPVGVSYLSQKCGASKDRITGMLDQLHLDGCACKGPKSRGWMFVRK